jgi:hypothetical protein
VTEREDLDTLKIVLDHAGQLAAIDILLRALVASHPNPRDLKTALEMLSTHFEVQVRDHAFDTNRGPDVARSITTTVQKQVDRWLEIFRSGEDKK